MALEPDVEEALARLERGEGLPPQRLAWEPRTAKGAVLAWVEARGMRRGAYAVSNAALAAAYTAHAKESGWALEEVQPAAMGRALKSLGYQQVAQGGVAGWRVDRDTSRALRLLAPPMHGHKRRAKRKARAPRRTAPLFWEVLRGPRYTRAKPLVDSMGRVWPSARVAAGLLLRVHYQDIQRSVAKGMGVGGVLWRHLTPDELQLVPPAHMVGAVLPALSWGRTVVVHAPQPCSKCGAQPSLDAGQFEPDGLATHPPPPSP
jgi:hypothetical protein